MKYIRTKDRIIDTLDCKECFLCNQQCWQPLKGLLVYEKDIVKQADYIRELLDEIIDNKNLVNILPLENIDLTKDKIYGAIWTDKGLIYVAKLNEKGKWELI